MFRNNFNLDWMFYSAKDEVHKTTVNLPHDAMLTEKLSKDGKTCV